MSTRGENQKVTSQEQKQLTHRRLIDVAREVFLNQGYEATSVGDIIKASGLSRATFYAHFASKDAVLREQTTEIWDLAVAKYADFAKLPDWSEASIRGWLDGILDVWLRYEQTVQLLTNTLLGDMRLQTEMREKRNVAAMLGTSERWLHLHPKEAERRAYLLIFQLERSFGEFASGRWKNIERESLIRTLTNVWLATLRAPCLTS